jgi:hypothetical protein
MILTSAYGVIPGTKLIVTSADGMFPGAKIIFAALNRALRGLRGAFAPRHVARLLRDGLRRRPGLKAKGTQAKPDPRAA